MRLKKWFKVTTPIGTLPRKIDGKQLALARHRVEQQPRRRDRRDVRALIVELAPEGAELLLVQVLVMLRRGLAMAPRSGSAGFVITSTLRIAWL